MHCLRESKTVLDSDFHAVDSEFFVSGTYVVVSDYSNRQCDSRIPGAVLGIPKPRFPDSTQKNFPDSGTKFGGFRNADSLS